MVRDEARRVLPSGGKEEGMSNSYVAVSLSGGKDSTAMLLMMIERRERIDEVVFCDTGMEHPEMYDHLDRLEADTGIAITRLRAPEGFEHMMLDHVMKKGRRKGDRGYGWPRPNARWCTSKLKTEVIARHFRKLKETCRVVQCIGIADDERRRVRELEDVRYPLVEYGVTEAQALAYCRERGYDWGGLYDLFGRVSCWCCPLQSLDELRTLRRERPELWRKMIDLDERSFNDFTPRSSVAGYEDRFEEEER